MVSQKILQMIEERFDFSFPTEDPSGWILIDPMLLRQHVLDLPQQIDLATKLSGYVTNLSRIRQAEIKRQLIESVPPPDGGKKWREEDLTTWTRTNNDYLIIHVAETEATALLEALKTKKNAINLLLNLEANGGAAIC